MDLCVNNHSRIGNVYRLVSLFVWQYNFFSCLIISVGNMIISLVLYIEFVKFNFSVLFWMIEDSLLSWWRCLNEICWFWRLKFARLECKQSNLNFNSQFFLREQAWRWLYGKCDINFQFHFIHSQACCARGVLINCNPSQNWGFLHWLRSKLGSWVSKIQWWSKNEKASI